MEEFALRAWDKKERKMVYIGLIDLKDMTIYNAKTLNGEFEQSYAKGNHNLKNWGNFSDLSFMRCSGFRTLGQDLVWEGDILREEDGDIVGVVWYDILSGCFHCNGYDLYDCKWCDVVGNIYEHPELMDGVEDKRRTSR